MYFWYYRVKFNRNFSSSFEGEKLDIFQKNIQIHNKRTDMEHSRSITIGIIIVIRVT